MKRHASHQSSIKDVAARAGVSIATVSRVVNGVPNKASPDTVERVRIAIAELTTRAKVAIDDIRQFEINEAFAATPLASTLHLANGARGKAQTLRQRTNPYGGAVAIGHPLGASGARLAMTLTNGLRRNGGGIGVAAICGGYGQGDALLIAVE